MNISVQATEYKPAPCLEQLLFLISTKNHNSLDQLPGLPHRDTHGTKPQHFES